MNAPNVDLGGSPAAKQIYDVFLSHSTADKPAVEEVARRLAQQGIQVWLDKWHLIPGDSWQPAIERALAQSETCAVFVGPSGLGPWQNEEMRAAIDRRVSETKSRFRVIPVLLPGAKRAERSSLPTFLVATTWVEFRNSLDDEAPLHRLVCGVRGVEPGPGPGAAIYEGQCPYRGLRVFDVGDAVFFFGREALVQWLLNEVRPATQNRVLNRFLAIVGASGGGKSSVARAGLIAALTRGAIANSSRWPITILRPGPDPIESLAIALSQVVSLAKSATALAELIAEFQKNEKTLHLIARQTLPQDAPELRLVLLVDQFEEIFTLCHRDDLRDAFIRNLLYAAKVAQGQTLVVLTMRADFYAKCAIHAELAAAFSDHHVLIGPMIEDELRRAIEKPAQLVGCELETGLVELLMEDVRHQPGRLPLLQDALMELWHKREGRKLTLKAYHEIGKVEGALQRRADEILKAFSQAEQELCRRTFLRLTQPGEGTEDTKRRASIRELLSLCDESPAEENIVQKLVNASLLTTEGELSQKDVFVEVAHEALIRSWPQLRKWIDADRAGLRTRTRLTEATHDWKNARTDPGYLYAGARLAVAEEWVDSHPGEASIDEVEFLRCSREAQKQREKTEIEAARILAQTQKERAEEAEKHANEQKEFANKLRKRAFAATGAAVAALILLTVSVFMWQAANHQRLAAEKQSRIAESRRLAAESSTALIKYPQQSVLLAVEAIRVKQSLDGVGVTVDEQSLREALRSIGGRPIAKADGPITTVAISPDNRWLVTGGADKTARLWDLSAKDPSANPLILRGHDGAANAVAFGSDNHWLATGSYDKTARLWDLRAKDPSANSLVLRGHDGVITTVAFSPDNRWLVTGSDDKTLRLWDLGAKDPAANAIILRGYDGAVTAVAFSPDNRWLAAGGADATLRLWDLRAKDPSAAPKIMRGPGGLVLAVAISPDSRWLATAAADDTGRLWLWDLNAKDPFVNPQILRGHDGAVNTVAFSPDSHWLATGSYDMTARLWDLRAKDPSANPLVLRGHRFRLSAVAFSPDNRWLVTGSHDKTAQLWDLNAKDPSANPLLLRGHDGWVTSVTFSPDNRLLVTGSYDKTARLWDLSSKDHSVNPLVLHGHDGAVTTVAFSPQNGWLATGGADKTVRLWDLNARDPLASSKILRGHDGAVSAVAFSPDERWLATGSHDKTARLWDLNAKDPSANPLVLRGHEDAVTAVAFSSDNRWLATGGADRTARLWDLNAKDPSANPKILRGHDGAVSAVAFSPDEHWLATGSNDKTALLWDLSAKDPFTSPLILRGHIGWITAVAFSPDNRWLATGSHDTTARLWRTKDLSANPIVLLHDGSVSAVAFSPDNRSLLTGSYDTTARLWDLSAKNPSANPIVLRGHRHWVTTVAFSPDNRWLATGSEDATARLSLLQMNDLMNLARIAVGRNFFADEWKSYFPDEKYRKTFDELPSLDDSEDN